MTEAEQRLWRELRALGFPIRFRRQHPIGRYFADFACPAAKLVVELDGGSTLFEPAQTRCAAKKSPGRVIA
jgi:very-short-patch-repair endonuclease